MTRQFWLDKGWYLLWWACGFVAFFVTARLVLINPILDAIRILNQ